MYKIISFLILIFLLQSTLIYAQEPVETAKKECVSGDCINGKGTAKFSNGDYYDGDFKNNKMNGQGTMKFKNLGTYIGAFSNDKASGKGKISFVNGDIYEGDFIEGNFNGEGKYSYKNGEIYTGNWVNDKKEGTGTYKFLNGHTHIGQFLDDRANGKGKRYDDKGILVKEGIWKDNLLVSTNNTSTQNEVKVVAKKELNKVSKENEIIESIGVQRNYILQKLKAAVAVEDNDKAKLPFLEEALKKQHALVQYMTEAVNGDQLSESTKVKYTKYLQMEKEMIKTLDDLALEALINSGL